MMELRPYEERDAEYIVSWIRDEEVFRKWSADRYEHYPITADDMNRYYRAYACEDILYKMTALDDETIVGHFTMRFTDVEKRVLRLGFVIVDDGKRGQGYGKQMLKLAIQYAFEVLEVDKITLGVFENNDSAYFCYKAVGFQDVQMKEAETYHVLGEDWKCLELELVR